VAEGELYVTGRIKDLIISGGRNIHPEDIEALTQGLPEVRPGRAVAFGLEDPQSGTEQIILVCETRSPLAQTEHWALVRELRRRTQQMLALALADVRLVEAGWVIKTSSGKISRSANREKYRSQLMGSRGATEPGPGHPNGGT
jgi:acyl-CoA synthetase (AMP-forming)/AMP-acid ligase II